MKGVIPAVAPVIKVDPVLAVATVRSPSRIGLLRFGSHNGSHAKSQKIEQDSYPEELGGGAEGI